MKKDLPKSFRIIYAGDRDIAVNVLKFIRKQGIKPLALLLSDKKKATHRQELIKLCDYFDSEYILEGNLFKTKKGIKLIKSIKPDYIIGIHFPYIFPKSVLDIPKKGVINLHPAYLPYNKGWHTPTWSIWNNTPYGATLHFMDEGVDSGDIIGQKLLEIYPNDTADKLYDRVKKLELELFKEKWLSLITDSYVRCSQEQGEGDKHTRTDIESLQELNLNEKIRTGDLIRKLRALSTNKAEEAAFFKIANKIYRIQIRITEDQL
jgi:methionyl-tRNA formyltransferase